MEEGTPQSDCWNAKYLICVLGAAHAQLDASGMSGGADRLRVARHNTVVWSWM